MKTSNEKGEKICWKCKRILVGESKLPLCPDCINNYGTKAAVICIAGLTLVGRKALKNSEKISKGVLNVVKHIK